MNVEVAGAYFEEHPVRCVAVLAMAMTSTGSGASGA